MKPRLRTRRRAICGEESGFTLVELLIALVISALIVGPITGAIIVGLRTTGSASTRLSQTRDIELVQGILPRDMFTAAQVYVKGQTNTQAANTCAGKSGGAAAGLDSLVVMTWSTTSVVAGSQPPTTTPPVSYEVDYVYSHNTVVPPAPQTGSLTRYLYITTGGTCSQPPTTNILATSLNNNYALQTAAVTNNSTTGSALTLTLTDSSCAQFAASGQERSPATTTTTTTTPASIPACTPD